MATLNEIVKEILMRGVSITMSKNAEQGFIEYDLGVNAKSGLRLYEDDGVVIAKGRYDEEVVETVDDVYFAVTRCQYGRPFINPKWREILEEEGYSLVKEECTCR